MPLWDSTTDLKPQDTIMTRTMRVMRVVLVLACAATVAAQTPRPTARAVHRRTGPAAADGAAAGEWSHPGLALGKDEAAKGPAPASKPSELPFFDYREAQARPDELYREAPSAAEVKRMTTKQLRDAFLIETLFTPGEVTITYTQHDRMVTGGAQPDGDAPLALPDSSVGGNRAPFLARRELAVYNVGGPGRVLVDGEPFDLGTYDALYIPSGTSDVVFQNANPSIPAKFWLAGAPCHVAYKPVRIVTSEAQRVPFPGDAASNRTLYRYVTPDRVPSCQLVMGVTFLEPGAVWNQLPGHLHPRRSEMYMYFNMKPDARVVHILGEPSETRHVIVANEQGVMCPSWSVHIGAGAGGEHAIAWAMAGENQAPEDRYRVSVTDVE
jgi:4-deoxy-L-threo-5-hexosulose-uronate ketol-isomerase